jgi:hypothetical protein
MRRNGTEPIRKKRFSAELELIPARNAGTPQNSITPARKKLSDTQPQLSRIGVLIL